MDADSPKLPGENLQVVDQLQAPWDIPRRGGVRLVQPVPLPPTEVLFAETLSTSFDIRTLLERSSEVLGTVDRVDLGRPRIRLARAADGQWSVEPFLRLSRGRRRSAFRGVIEGKAKVKAAA